MIINKSLNILILFFLFLILPFSIFGKLITSDDVLSIKASDEAYGNKAENCLDENTATRWETTHGVDPVWLKITFKKEQMINAIKIIWEKASAKVYEIHVSKDNKHWKNVAIVNDGAEGEDRFIKIDPVKTKYIRIYGKERRTQYGYSIWEIIINPPILKTDNLPFMNPKLSIEKRVDDLIKRMTLKEKINELCGKDFMDCKKNWRLGIPPLLMTDGPHGVRDMYGNSTCFPTLVTMGATWDTDLIRKVGAALGRETRGKGRNLILGPCINIHRTPLGGRNFESFSEDPFLVAQMAAAYVKGVQSEKVGTSTKHFVANNQEWERFTISVEISERALREIYLPGFKSAVCEAGTTSIMGAYNKINGTHCCENSYILKDILKKEWGFKGFVVSDWWAIKNGIKAANNGCDMEMPGPGKHYTRDNLLKAVQNKQVKQSEIDDKVKRILYVKFFLGLFDGVEKKYKGAVNTKEHQILTRKIAENGIVLLKNQGDILPLNRNKIKSIAVIGPNAVKAGLGGGGSSQVGPPYSVSPLQGIRKECKGKIKIKYLKGCNMPDELDEMQLTLFRPDNSSKEYGLKGEYFNNIDFQGKPIITRVDKKIHFNWERRSPVKGLNDEYFSIRWTGIFIPEKTGEYELFILSDDGSRLFIDDKLVINNWGDHRAELKKNKLKFIKNHKYNIRIEFYDRTSDAVIKFSWRLPDTDPMKEAEKIAKKADVALLFVGLNKFLEGEGVDRTNMRLPNHQDELIKTISKANKNTIVVLVNGTPVNMMKWLNKVPAVLETWYSGQEAGHAIANVIFGKVNPSGKLPVTFPKRLKDNPSYKNYPGKNGKVHYKEGVFVGYRYYDTKNVEPLFPFGHGLSYTEFKYDNLRINPNKVKQGKKFTVSLNVKNIGKREGKEVVQLYIRDKKSSLQRPFKELKAFKKINLKPNRKKKVTFHLDNDALSYYHPKKKKWITESGEFEVFIGSSSKDIRLRGRFNLIKEK